MMSAKDTRQEELTELGLDDAALSAAWDGALAEIRASGRDPGQVVEHAAAVLAAWSAVRRTNGATTMMTMTKFPTPAEISERRKTDASAEIDAALTLVENMLICGESVAPIEWSATVRAAVKERLRASGWAVSYGKSHISGRMAVKTRFGVTGWVVSDSELGGVECVEVLPIDTGAQR